MNPLQQAAHEIISSHSFDFCDFYSAVRRYKFFISQNKKHIEYNALALLISEHNLSSEEYLCFSNYFRIFYHEKFQSNLEIQMQTEYKQLYPFVQKFIAPRNYHLMKNDPLDFFIEDLDHSRKIGIEVTLLTRNSKDSQPKESRNVDQIQSKIAEEFLHSNPTMDQAREYIKRHHTTYLSTLQLYERNGYCTAIGLKPPKTVTEINRHFNLSILHEDYAWKIKRKYQKFLKWNTQFSLDEKIILCAVDHPLAFTGERDLHEIAESLYSEFYALECKVYIFNILDSCTSDWGIINLTQRTTEYLSHK